MAFDPNKGILVETPIKTTGGFNPSAGTVLPEEQQGGRFSNTGFMQRLKLGFGSTQAAEQQHELEKSKGLRGKFDIGDIADVAGSALPIIGGILGGAGGTILGAGVGAIPGSAIGSTAGQALKQTIGGALGVRKDVTPLGETIKPLATGAFDYLGGKATKYVISRLPRIFGLLSGESDETVKLALSNPKAADLGIQQGDEALRNIVKEGSDKTIQMRTTFVQAQKEAFDKLAQENTNKLVPKQKILNQFLGDLVDKGVRVEDGTLNFATSKIKANPGEIGKINAAYEAISQWDDFSLKGVNELKQLVGSLTKFADDAGIPSKSPFLGQYYKYLDDTIKGALPEKSRITYTVMNKRFSDTIDMYDDLVDAFTKGDPFVRLANSLGDNKDTLRQILKFYDEKTGSGVLSTIAGRSIGAEKQAAFGFLNPRFWIDFAISPKAQGGIITRTGKIVNPLRSATQSTYQGFQKALGVNPLNLIKFK